MKDIIIFRTDRLGDYLINSRPIFEIKKKFKNTRITIVCSKINKKILNKSSYVDNIIEFNKTDNFLSKFKTFISIINKKYDVCFVLDGKKFSYFCNIFIRSKLKLGVSYILYRKLLYKFKILKSSKLYNYFFFNHIEFFPSKNYLIKSESFCQKYLNLFKNVGINLTVNDNYIFENPEYSKTLYSDIVTKLNFTDYIIIHLDEKWNDIKDIKINFADKIKILQKKINLKIIITSYNNNFDYFNLIKNKFDYYNLNSNALNYIADKNIVILDNLDIFLFERFLRNSKLNISCHSGFVVQVCGANNAKVLDIINEKDLQWYSSWKPQNTFHKFIFKSTFKNGKIEIDSFFDEIYSTIKTLY